MPNGGQSPRCIECGDTSTLVHGDVIYPHRPEFHHKLYWRCRCGAYVGCHPDTEVALGFPAGPETRKARNAAHAAFDPIWKTKRLRRGAAYQWLANQLRISRDDCHIAMMTVEEAREVVRAVRKDFG